MINGNAIIEEDDETIKILIGENMSVEQIIEFAKGKEYDCYGRLLFEGEFVNGKPSKGKFKKYFEDKLVFEV